MIRNPLAFWESIRKAFAYEDFESEVGPWPWVPDKTYAQSANWSAIVRSSFLPIHWNYSTHYYSNAAWHPMNEDARFQLTEFTITLAEHFSSLDSPLWLDKMSESDEYIGTAVCFDIRLMNFSPTKFCNKDVLDGIARIAFEARNIAKGAAASPRRWRSRPTRDYDFIYHTISSCTFCICFYRQIDSIAWPKRDTLRPVPDADFKELATELSSKFAKQLQEVPLLVHANLPARPAAHRGRPSAERRLDIEVLSKSISQFIAQEINPFHDAVISAFQVLLDEIAHKACPLLANNKSLCSLVMNTAGTYGIRLYFEWQGSLELVSLASQTNASASKANPATPSAMAGVFYINAYDTDRGRTRNLTTQATFPPLIAARSKEDAQRILEARG